MKRSIALRKGFIVLLITNVNTWTTFTIQSLYSENITNVFSFWTMISLFFLFLTIILYLIGKNTYKLFSILAIIWWCSVLIYGKYCYNPF